LGQLMDTVQAALPRACPVTLVGDRGVTGPEVIAQCRRVGWHFTLRLNTGPTHPVMWRASPQDADRPVWSLVPRAGQRWSGRGQIYKTAGWVNVQLTIHWTKGAEAPWMLVSDQPGGADRVREYRRRVR